MTHIKKTPQGYKFCDKYGNIIGADIGLNKKSREIIEKANKILPPTKPGKVWNEKEVKAEFSKLKCELYKSKGDIKKLLDEPYYQETVVNPPIKKEREFELKDRLLKLKVWKGKQK